ncbi:MAG: class II fumarate hydratase [Verrucomicrobiota bacterium]
MNETFRIETDSMGEMDVPVQAYFGAQTARAVANFPISGLRFSREFIRALGLVKKHAAITNFSLGYLSPEISQAIQQAAVEVIDGKLDSEFVVDIFQTGSGTSTNMNANEVIASRATELLGGKRGGKLVHANDHVNRGQSSNDVIPTAIHLAALESMERKLIPALSELLLQLRRKAEDFHAVIKIGRTHFQDATPIRLGQEFSGYASQVENGIARLRSTEKHLGELALGGTAIGTGINTHPDFAKKTIAGIAVETGLALRETSNHFEAQGARDAAVETSGALKTVAISLIKIANDIRFLASGPRLGIGELKLPATQPGSSIMPAKVNPVMCEMIIQVGAQVVGNDAAIAVGGILGHLELNTMMPLIAHNLLQSIELLGNASRTFAVRCVAGIEADTEKCRALIEQSLAMSTALAPKIGYDKAAQIAKLAYESNRTVRQVAKEISGLDIQTLDRLLNPENQTAPTSE